MRWPRRRGVLEAVARRPLGPTGGPPRTGRQACGVPGRPSSRGAAVVAAREEMRRKLAVQGDIEGALAELEREIAGAEQAARTVAGTLRMAREQVEYMLDLLARGEVSQDRVDVARAAMNTQLYNTQSALAAHFGAAVQYLSSKGLDPLGKPAVKH